MGKMSTFINLERRNVTSRHHGSKITASQQSFLTETAIFIVGFLTETAIFIVGCSLVPECSHAQESHVNFFLQYLQDHGLLDTMAT